ncbi:MAG: phosphatidylglycerophosphatase A [Paracoccus sp. (in: a-proteobacteria)]|uniref:phosphatidylglycerophosphatase A family protein n=1 Tax=Paracoccus sp. TaxID=267 RepID=UPI0026E0C7DB|nr:phosphatidylglycerophosphatase A [Paracoccus sp. (in: a-proteobacteria)]MDO5622327.1 phosphatidylglycerophosphatase A [Paracoccus sp. (in: a-proteobacteria)]
MDKLLATWFGVGWLRPASGTWGSAVAVAMGVGLHMIGHFWLLLVSTVAVTVVGFWAVRRYTEGMADKDRSEIVIDEVAGQWIALCFPSFGFWLMGLPADRFPYPGWLAAFLFFRLFDIWKPWLVGRADRRKDADGVMIDDLWAGLFAGLSTMAAAAFSHLVLM